MNEKKLNIIIPQWQGGGQDYCTWYGAYALRDNYLKDEQAVTVDIPKNDISATKNNIRGYEDILACMDKVTAVLREKDPEKIFAMGGGCDADTPCSSYLNKKYGGDMAMVYIDAHGDLNTPEASASKLYYGMSLRALCGEGDQGILGKLSSAVRPSQLIMCANRNLDPEEIRFKKEQNVSDFTVETLNNNPGAVAEEIARKGYHHVYIHIDFDSLDPSAFPLTPVKEPDGLKAETLVKLVQAVRESGADIVGFGLLEYCGTAKDTGNALLEKLTAFGKAI